MCWNISCTTLLAFGKNLIFLSRKVFITLPTTFEITSEYSLNQKFLGPPDPPSGKPYVTDTTSTSAVVLWNGSPYDGGRIVTGYILEYSLAGSDVWTTAVDDWSYLSYEVQGLRPGARYVFRVKAINVHGTSKPSLESDVVALEEYGMRWCC